MLDCRTSRKRIAILYGVHGGASQPPLTAENVATPHCTFVQDKAPLRRDGKMEQDTLRTVQDASGVILKGFSLSGVDALFRLRAVQLLSSQPYLDAAAVVYIAHPPEGGALVPGLGRRIAASWPFRSVLFVADGVAAAALAKEGLPVVSSAEAEWIGMQGLFAYPAPATSSATKDQSIGVQIQPMWGRCGSSTAFANEIDCLIDKGFFTLRIFVDHQRRAGATTDRQLQSIITENTIDTGPHIEGSACSQRVVDTKGADEFEAFENSVRMRAQAALQDDLVTELALRAKVAIVNHAYNMSFAMRVCPEASIVLDTHDYLSRNALERARTNQDKQAFPNCRTLRNHVTLESKLWQAADICTTVSHDEEVRVRRRSPKCLVVFPEPCAKPWIDPRGDAEWDLLLVADQHFFNIQSVAWFLEEVVRPNSRLKQMRIAIVGRVKRHLEPSWSDRLPNVKWLGFVSDLDETRSRSRLAICAERGGTGISIKTLTALAAGQPMVATLIALRGLPKNVADMIPTCDDAAAMAQEILRLIDDPDLARQRCETMSRARDILKRDSSYSAAIDLATTRSAKTAEARQYLQRAFSKLLPTHPPKTPYGDGEIRLDFKTGGNASAYLDARWHDAEVWGRWMDGGQASLRLPAAWFVRYPMLEIKFMDPGWATRVAVVRGGQPLTPPNLAVRDRSAVVKIDRSVPQDADGMVTLDIVADPTVCPADSGEADDRVLGAGVEAIRVFRSIERAPRADRIELNSDGSAEPYLGSGWHAPEEWGRWTSSARASLHFPFDWFTDPVSVRILFRASRPVEVAVAHRGRALASCAVTQDSWIEIQLDVSVIDAADDMVTLDIHAASTYCPAEQGNGSTDRRILGVPVNAIEFVRPKFVRPKEEPWRTWLMRVTRGRVGSQAKS